MTDLDRNNTNFSSKLGVLLDKVLKQYDTESILKYYQHLIVEYFAKINVSNSRGLLVYVGMGLGKSIIAAAAIDALTSNTYSENNKSRDIIVMLSKSLQSNFEYAIEKWKEMNKNSNLHEININYITLNAANVIKKLAKVSNNKNKNDKKNVNIMEETYDDAIYELLKIKNLNNKILVVDEAHNLFRRIVNGSKIALELYDLIMNSHNLKILFATGTPLSSSIYEAIPCFNMLNIGDTPLFPENVDDFDKLFVSPEGSIKNKEKFQNRIFGLVSYVSHDTVEADIADIAGTTDMEKENVDKSEKSDLSIKDKFPTVFPLKIIKVPMTDDQFAQYLLARDTEKQENKQQMKKQKKSNNRFNQKDVVSTYRVRSRQISNFMPPKWWNHKKFADLTDDLMTKELEKLSVDELISPKMDIITDIINDSDGIGIVYSQFTGIGGLGSLIQKLKHKGFKEYKINKNNDNLNNDINHDLGDEEKEHISIFDDDTNRDENNDLGDENIDLDGGNDKKDKKQYYFAVYTGKVDADIRTKIKDIYNSIENINGDLIKVLLISETGVEGLDLKNTRFIIQMEPYFNMNRTNQLEFRGNRFESHINLPKEKQNLQVYILISVHSKNATQKQLDELTTDEHIYDQSIINQNKIDSFTNAYKEVCIECSIRKDEHCRKCLPTNQKLFTDNVDLDVINYDPCKPMEEETIKAEKLLFNNDTYYFSPNDNSIYKYSIYTYDNDIGGIVEIEENTDLHLHLIDEINKKITK